MRRILRRDLVREVKKTFARFISIAILIGMGTAFFIGLNSAAPTMLHTANAYFKEYHYQDIKVMAPVDFYLEDVQKIAEIELVEAGSLGYLTQTLVQPGNMVLEVLSFENKKEQFNLIEGRYPRKSGELALDSKGSKYYKIGEKLKFLLADGKPDSAFRETSYKIVGILESTRYISKNSRGASAIGDGSVDLFGVISQEDFTKKVPNTIDIELVSKSREKNLYSSTYEADLDKAKIEVEAVMEAKMAESTKEIKLELLKQEKDLGKQRNDLTNQRIGLEKEMKELNSSKKVIEEEKKTALAGYDEAKKLLAEHQEELLGVKNRLLISEGAIANEAKRLESVAKQIITQQETLSQLLAENDPEKAETVANLEGINQRLVASYENEQGLQQVELGKQSAIREQFLSIDQLVQLEVANLPDVEKLNERFVSLEKERADGERELEEALTKVEDGSTELSKLSDKLDREMERSETISYKIQGIDETETFKPFKENIERLSIFSKVIPFVFFFVAFIITTTLILRMVDQSREQIGTLLALGVNHRDISRKYTLYTLFSSVMGLGLGIYLGIFWLPQIIIGLYAPMYNFSYYQPQIYLQYIVVSLLASLISVVIIPYFVYRKLFRLPVLQLIRPKIDNGGRHLLIERIPWLWCQLPFLFQRTLRNIKSYKVRMGVLLIGFVGCMSLLFISYGARNSVDQLQKKQFYEVFKYDISVGISDFASVEEKRDYLAYIDSKQAKRLPVLQEKWASLMEDNERVETFLVIPEQSKELNHYIELTDAGSGKSLILGPEDVFVTEKLAKIFNLKVGDSWQITNTEGILIAPKVTKIVKNYYLHYVYLGEEAYSSLLGSPVMPQRDFLSFKELSNKDSETLLNFAAVSDVHTRNQDVEKMKEVTAQLNNLVVVMIVAAVLLGVVVLYNLAYITILERKQEIAVMRVMGYRQMQVTLYIFREISLLGCLSVFIGSAVGKLLHQLVMEQVALEFIFFPQIEIMKVFNKSGITLLSIASLLMVLMHQKIKQINTVEALKVKD